MKQLCERRKSIGDRRLLQLRRDHDALVAERGRLQETIDLLTESARIDALDGRVADRAALFDWLRKGATLRYRTQLLRVDLAQSDEKVDALDQRVGAQRDACRVLDERRQRYADAQKKARAHERLVQMNIEEAELEDRKSWST
ncbi:hypothetical protein WL21_04690 [Burkholderia ubonensis]|nr:hypothetical protein WJ81_15660 [Burkholderia ubonensis]KVZ57301.1 hypothetical protein WL20_23445 [Burkholderia ubonensis]KVZ72998.1 hypothetical protein WL21_04690 [Burkholderia ubonensis]